ncbi:GGDEF domain-containing protein [Cognaticolwellia beringensis]|uniref:diguanylate cyclase n=1 Tax=Cognaticolwellia beringensis TaxID=1967665 RepID=A0A222G9S7_9GAMM|nr:GGDEF domain-containing protein [Cognaticolwellia beringensis]ASP48551.1 GGDEF domain-containing protein [Cognaticolwellia beringensis]
MNKVIKLRAAVFVGLSLLINTLVNTSAMAEESQDKQQGVNILESSDVQQQELLVDLAINAEILSLISLSEQNKTAAQIKLLALNESSLTLNVAEQYLLNVIRGNIANLPGQEHKVINWLNKAIKLESSLAKKQLDTPLFANTYLILANIYEKKGEAQKAYDSKKQYIEKYFSHLKEQKEHRVKQLNEKYNIEKKREENELLTQNSQIKHYALASAESERIQQHRNITIFIVAGMVLFLLLLRQFKIRRALKLLAKRDSLTRLPNRRSFFSSGDTYMAQAQAADKELSVLMMGIDSFIMINDELGHDVVDKVICRVAALASETMRSRDFFSRISDEEFAAILPDASIEQARAIAEHIREKIQNDTKDNQLNNLEVTVSIGIASIQDVKGNFDNLLHAADMAMYQAKANGRNQVCSYSTDIKEN